MKAESFWEQEKQHLGQYNEETLFNQHLFRATHKKGFEIVCGFTDESILQNKKAQLTKDLSKLYLAALGDVGGSKYRNLNISSDKLFTKYKITTVKKNKLEQGKTEKRKHYMWCVARLGTICTILKK